MKIFSAYRNEIKGMMWLFALQGLSYIFPMLVWPYLGKTLGATTFGLISFAFALSQTLMIIVDFGFNMTATKDISLHKEDKQTISQIFSTTLTAKILLLFIAFGILCIVLSRQPFKPYRTVSFVMFLMVVANTFSFHWLYQGIGKLHLVILILSFTRILSLPFFLYVKTSNDVILASLLVVAPYVVSSIGVIGMTFKLKLIHFVQSSFNNVLICLKDSFPIFISTAISSFYALIFPVILGYFATQQEVGIYGFSEKIMRSGTTLFLIPCLQILFPYLSRIAQKDRKQAKKVILLAFASSFLWNILLGSGMFLFANPILAFLGRGYANAQPIFSILALIPIMIGISGVFGQLGLIALGGEKEKQMFRNVYVSACLVSIVAIFITAYSGTISAFSMSLILLITETYVAIGMIGGYCKMSRRLPYSHRRLTEGNTKDK